MARTIEHNRRRAEFFALSDFSKYVYPLLEERKDDLVRTLLDHGEESDRFRILEIERLVDIFEGVDAN